MLELRTPPKVMINTARQIDALVGPYTFKTQNLIHQIAYNEVELHKGCTTHDEYTVKVKAFIKLYVLAGDTRCDVEELKKAVHSKIEDKRQARTGDVMINGKRVVLLNYGNKDFWSVDGKSTEYGNIIVEITRGTEIQVYGSVLHN